MNTPNLTNDLFVYIFTNNAALIYDITLYYPYLNNNYKFEGESVIYRYDGIHTEDIRMLRDKFMIDQTYSLANNRQFLQALIDNNIFPLEDDTVYTS